MIPLYNFLLTLGKSMQTILFFSINDNFVILKFTQNDILFEHNNVYVSIAYHSQMTYDLSNVVEIFIPN